MQLRLSAEYRKGCEGDEGLSYGSAKSLRVLRIRIRILY